MSYTLDLAQAEAALLSAKKAYKYNPCNDTRDALDVAARKVRKLKD